MNLSNQILFFFSALGVFNAFVFCGYIFFFLKPRRLLNYFLGLIVLMLSLRVGVSCFYFFEKDIPRVFIQIGLMANALLGSLIFIYVKSILINERRVTKQDRKHLTIFSILLLTFSIAYPFSKYPEFWDHRIRYIIHTILTIYLLLSTYYLLPTIKSLPRKDSKVLPEKRWTFLLLIANLLIAFGFVISLKTTYALGAVWFSIVFYALMFYLFLNKKKIQIFEKENSSGKIGEKEERILLNRINSLMNEKKPYNNPNLKVDSFANELGITPNKLSQFLNENMGKNFSTFLNEYRVEEAKRILTSNTKYTIEAVGYEAGFSSKSSFYSIFRKITGITPLAFQKENTT